MTAEGESFDPEAADSAGEGNTDNPDTESAAPDTADEQGDRELVTASPTTPEVTPPPALQPPAAGQNPSPTPSAGNEQPGEDSETLPTAPAQLRATLTTSGRQILDRCGQPIVMRGVEQIFGEQLPQGNDWVALIEEIAATGVNAVRVLAGEALEVSDVDALLTVVGERGMVAYVTPYGNEATGWLERADVREMLGRHEGFIIIDAFGEPTFDDRERFIRDSTESLRQVREWGYRVPLTVTANQFGRDLPSILELGAEIIAADPLNNTIMGWQAYWGSSGYYEGRYGLTLNQAIQAVASAPFPIQLGLDRVTDFPSTETADFETLMAGTAANGIGWLWWDWFNPYGTENNLTQDGSAARLTPTGVTVMSTHPASVSNTSKLPCSAP